MTGKKEDSKTITLEKLRKLIYFLEYQGLKKDISYKITILDDGTIDLFIGDVQAEYGENEYAN